MILSAMRAIGPHLLLNSALDSGKKLQYLSYYVNGVLQEPLSEGAKGIQGSVAALILSSSPAATRRIAAPCRPHVCQR